MGHDHGEASHHPLDEFRIGHATIQIEPANAPEDCHLGIEAAVCQVEAAEAS